MTISLAAVFTGKPGEVELWEIPRPAPADGELLVRILGCTLCGSDLHSFEGRRQVAVPTILGHETVGEIVAFGDGAPRHDLTGAALAVGSRVTWSLVASCGHCFFCQRGLPQKCVHSTKYGHEAFRPGRELLGGLAEHCLIVPGTSLVQLPPDLPLEVACPANCATATAAAAVEAAGLLPGATVCILGAGLLGLSVTAMAKIARAAEIICVEVDPARRARAKEFGATQVLAPDELSAAIESLTDGRGIDAAFELSGTPAAFSCAWPTIRIGGTFVVVGSVFPSAPVELYLEQLVRRHLVVRGIHNYAPHHLLYAVQFLESSATTFPWAELISQWHSLAEVATALASARDRTKIRVGVRPQAA